MYGAYSHISHRPFCKRLFANYVSHKKAHPPVQPPIIRRRLFSMPSRAPGPTADYHLRSKVPLNAATAAFDSGAVTLKCISQHLLLLLAAAAAAAMINFTKRV
jgi:hypothetical protein